MKKRLFLSHGVRSALLENAKLMAEPKGAVLFRRGEPSFGVFLVRKGSVSLRLESPDGKPVLHGTASRDAVVGLPATLAGGEYSLTAVAREKTEIAFVDRDALIGIMKADSSIAVEIVRALGDEVVRMREVLASTPVRR